MQGNMSVRTLSLLGFNIIARVGGALLVLAEGRRCPSHRSSLMPLSPALARRRTAEVRRSTIILHMRTGWIEGHMRDESPF